MAFLFQTAVVLSVVALAIAYPVQTVAVFVSLWALNEVSKR